MLRDNLSKDRAFVVFVHAGHGYRELEITEIPYTYVDRILQTVCEKEKGSCVFFDR
jgi:hypothetical protein